MAHLQIHARHCAIYHSSLCDQLCVHSGIFEKQIETRILPWASKALITLIHLLKMAVKLWGSKTPGNAQDLRDITLLKNKKKVIKMLVIVVVLFCVAWFPLQTYNILNVTWPEVNEYQHIQIIWLCCDWLAMSNSCYNPFIYGIYNVRYFTLSGYSSKFITFFHLPRRSSSANSTSGSHFSTNLDSVSVFALINLLQAWPQVLRRLQIIQTKLCQPTTPVHQFHITHRTL